MSVSLIRWAGLVLCAFIAGSVAAAEVPYVGQPGLVPIQETVKTIQLDQLAAVPVQHGGRYKPLFSMAMEVSDSIAYSTSFPHGHTPLTSLLDLLFCRSDYDDLPIARVKHTELRRDLALVIPEAERQLLLKDGYITPSRLTSQTVRDELEKLGRLTSKNKAISQVQSAQGMLDPGNVIFQLRLFPVPVGAHDDRWRDPAELGLRHLAECFLRRCAHQRWIVVVVCRTNVEPVADFGRNRNQIALAGSRRISESESTSAVAALASCRSWQMGSHGCGKTCR
jgi:hypothetical protein